MQNTKWIKIDVIKIKDVIKIDVIKIKDAIKIDVIKIKDVIKVVTLSKLETSIIEKITEADIINKYENFFNIINYELDVLTFLDIGKKTEENKRFFSNITTPLLLLPLLKF